MEIKLKDWTGFLVTGVDRYGKRFRTQYPSDYPGAMTAFGINMWQGSVWGLKNGKRTLLKRVYN